MALPASLMYFAELWRPAKRGAVCCVPTLAVVLGRGMAFALEHRKVLEPGDAALVGLAPALLGLLLLLLLAPPSPYWLALRGREVSLGRALARLRGLRDERGARDEADDVVDTVREQRSGVCAGNVLPMRAKAWLPALAVLVYAACRTATEAAYVMVPMLVREAADNRGRYFLASCCYGHALWALVLAAVMGGLLPETNGFTLAQLHEIFRGPNRQTLQTRL
ncbi:uncharacterized protein LOC117644023 [Thrips palmi]|uniref:Uncharacterized protein LOC117644023 n=1 Tax=Thrips palmi TaxID=161013 RepID=A0A6P8YQ89_THRPL|nr:uncharacterized protein LOC117644023 [Thrips palmi]